MSAFRELTIVPPVTNTACPWASNLDDLTALYECSDTGAVTTRTATLKGFPDDPTVHQVAFASESLSSVNCYGYSPYPLSQYIEWVKTILQSHPDSNKPIIISITAPLPHDDDAVPTHSLDISSQEEEMIEVSPHAEGSSSHNELPEMLAAIQALRAEFDDATSASPRIAVEINTSCPNIEGHPPPSYDISSLRSLVKSVAEVCRADPSLAVGIKLPPYVYARQFVDVIDFIASFTEEVGGKKRNPIAFLTCTNTLGSSLMFSDQVIQEDQAAAEAAGGFALPATWGGLAGESLHPLSLGNVHAFRKLINAHQDEAIRSLAIIGAGGVFSADSADRMFRAGADVVGCATALGRKGISVFADIVKAPSISGGTKP
ncbi:dihydroorotate dehydrogenase [Tulasnella sp. 408]|nr:dihydroorotate dehydrogenase [Tulasnella sp. 408]